MRAVRQCVTFDELVDRASAEAVTYVPPLEHDCVIKAAQSAWGYQQRGENRFGMTGAFFSTETALNLVHDPHLTT
jgi:hypothetical protein